MNNIHPAEAGKRCETQARVQYHEVFTRYVKEHSKINFHFSLQINKFTAQSFCTKRKNMPKNKNASFRYRVIDNCLRNTGRSWTLNDLIETVSEQMTEQFGIDKGISKRTIQYDLNVMRSDPPRGFAAPIVCENGYYFYEDAEYSIDKNPLNLTDIQSINEAAALLKQFRHIPLYDEFTGILSKIQENAIIEGKEDIIDFEKNTDYKNIEMLSGLYEALKKKKVMDFFYQSFKSKQPVNILIHPYLLKEYRNRWFVLGWNEEYRDFTNLALDRIVQFNVTDVPCDFAMRSELQALLARITGVTIPEIKRTERILCKVDTVLANYLLSKPVHKSQHIIEKKKDYYIFAFELMINYELKQLLLGYGKSVVVLQPESLRKEILDTVSETCNNYQ